MEMPSVAARRFLFKFSQGRGRGSGSGGGTNSGECCSANAICSPRNPLNCSRFGLVLVGATLAATIEESVTGS